MSILLLRSIHDFFFGLTAVESICAAIVLLALIAVVGIVLIVYIRNM